LRFGIALFPVPQCELGAAFEAALATDTNADNRTRNDTEPSDDFNLDLLYLVWRPRSDIALAGGRRALPLQLTALIWDDDLRPVGGSIATTRAWRAYDAWRIAAGWFVVRSLAESWVHLAAAQTSYTFHDGAPRRGAARLAYLHYDHTASLVTDGLARTNRVQSGDFAATFDLLDLQIEARSPIGSLPGLVQAEWVENLSADAESSGYRLGAGLGEAVERWQVALRYFFQRLESDAVLAAFNSDDWWFHSRMRGHRAVLGVGLGHGVRVEASGSIERRDDRDDWIRRARLDLHAVW
jgi:hypothetical protein